MTKMLTHFAILPMACMTLLLAPGCGDSLANGKPIAAEKAFALTEAEGLALTSNAWKRQTQERYTSFLEFNQDRTGGFICNNDGKSANGQFWFLELNGEIVMKVPAGHNPDVKVLVNLQFQGDNLVISGMDKDLSNAVTYSPISEFPPICKRIKAGEKPTMDEYMATWDPR